ncbi:RagB/SusD family nutrient uptake outer membrane protein [Zobellia galactanivorans]|uniref:RagB/SusD family nutrient uptake outer membrane protein n=1 Tax=Zobellia galactanivorans (strain DSM 12802 / CCUG 47099 / CIP 106680 / NCIMB 13871 / Dsij) TaxID=63186 RepID=UPI001C0696F8|nr:RagB/SusD family nutrient uptake outer membrane protein [Zobellia galactanivorans]MBU3024225.1 RagB/SusD family nutrient uptake outer membrane protein [Zobellia galactanivorans]
MKTTITKRLFAIIIPVLAFVGCSDDFLEQTNPNQISTETFWKDNKDLEQGLIGTYKGFANANNINLVGELARTDLAWASGYQRPNNTNEYYLQIFNDASSVPNNKWSANYTTIFRANQVIEAAAKIGETYTTEKEKEEGLIILAQARFIRGYIYFNLYNTFNKGAVPIFDFVPVKESEFYQPIASAEEVKKFYMEDLKFASENLPVSWEDKEKGRVTAGAAVAVMGQSYLYEGDYETASTYFKSVIDDYGYSLTPNIGSNFTTMDEFNEESILEVGYSLDFKNELGAWDGRDVANPAYVRQFTGGDGTWRGAIPANWLILKYRNEPLDFSDSRNKVVDEEGNESFRKFSLRTSWSVALVDDEDMGYYLREKTGQGSIFNVRMTAFWRKHTNWDITRSEEELSPGKVRSGVNERLIRLAEIYLQYAECQIKLGNVDEALVYINRVRRRSGVQLLGLNGTGEFPANDHDNKSYDAQSLMEHLMYTELPLELSAEGDGNRNIDLRRWGVKAERFKELAQRRYTADHYTLLDEEGKEVTRWASILKELPAGDPDIDENWNEFQEAANNYNDDLHAYWPLPNSEIISNPQLND